MTHMQILTEAFARIGIPFELTDDSRESPDIDDLAETVVLIRETGRKEGYAGEVYFFFARDGEYRDEIDIL